MRSSPRLFVACFAFFALVVLFSAPAGRASPYAIHRVRHAAPGTVQRLTGRHSPAGAEVSDTSVDDDDDDTADDDAGTSLHVGVPVETFRVVLAEALLSPEPPPFRSLLARSHVHATRAPPGCPLTTALTASAND